MATDVGRSNMAFSNAGPQSVESGADLHRRLGADFFVLLDGTPFFGRHVLLSYIQSKGYKVRELNLQQIAGSLRQQFAAGYSFPRFDRIVGLGDGGARTLTALLSLGHQATNLDVERVEVHWHSEYGIAGGRRFVHSLDSIQWRGARLLLVEDVVASGATILEAMREFGRRGADVVGIVTGVIITTPPLIDASSLQILAGVCVSHSRAPEGWQDSHWWPPLFSVRHLLYGDQENPRLFAMMAERYFGGDREFSSLIEKVRKRKVD